ncbi:MerR family transcriptional regulator [Jeotgalibacillus terrae]|uniref:MerR family transcriptional regulator n=1 Tax=Jeotgalibacillus terrae TaxID=587735 RepID=A0ABW5ZF03_9BACL|nr:MerR family transcriptional regulator [Jeotgalibacillus terrae]MBM7579102.1 DNA-binding transcriptional MerR regulator [Jeotgalibacillus terrae]
MPINLKVLNPVPCLYISCYSNLRPHCVHPTNLAKPSRYTVYFSYFDLREDDEYFGKALIRIGTVAKRSGLSTRTIDYYTQMGLLAFERSDSNYRLYPESVLETLKEIQLLKDRRMTLDEIKAFLEVKPVSKSPALEEVNAEIVYLEQKILSLKEEFETATPEDKHYIKEEIQLKMIPLLQLMTTLLS